MKLPSAPRRVFMFRVASGACALATGPTLAADEVSNEKLTEADPYAKSMGFRLDTAKVDQARFPRHTVEQHCSACQLFSPTAGTDWGSCSFFGGRQVFKNGWCRNFKAKKAA